MTDKDKGHTSLLVCSENYVFSAHFKWKDKTYNCLPTQGHRFQFQYDENIILQVFFIGITKADEIIISKLSKATW